MLGLALLLALPVWGQGRQLTLTPQASVSVITIAPGDPLWAAFGHSALRIQDPSVGLDKAYNYGIFDFTRPTFYADFAAGRLWYKLGTDPFHRLMREYEVQGRWVKEQIIDLSLEDKQAVFDYLEENAKPENANYLYHYFYDNCATRLLDVFSDVLGDRIKYNTEHLTEDYSIRDLVDAYTYEHPWGDFGIDLVLGSGIDSEATPREVAFLPDYTFLAFENAEIKGENGWHPAVLANKVVLDYPPHPAEYSQPITPARIMWLVLLIAVFLTIRHHKMPALGRTFDVLLFFILGACGVVMALIWFATDHTSTADNYNLIWAWPSHIVMAFFLVKAKWSAKVSRYFRVVAIFLLLTLVFWWAWPQDMHNALIPLLLAGALRSFRVGFVG